MSNGKVRHRRRWRVIRKSRSVFGWWPHHWAVYADGAVERRSYLDGTIKKVPS